GLDVWRFDAHWRGELASLVFEIGGGFNQPGRNRGVGGGPCHFEQRRCCLASVVAVLGHGTGSPIFWRMNAQPKISVPQRKYKTERTEAVPWGALVPVRWRVSSGGPRRSTSITPPKRIGRVSCHHFG